MKRLAALLVAVSMTPLAALAAGNHPMGGCGLGYLLLSNRENTKIMQVLGATTNGTFGSQTFGISSGTSGCTEDGAVKLVRAAEVFAEVNLETLRLEMATGRGEYVTAFASLLAPTSAQQAELVSLFQSSYGDLFPTAETTSGDMLHRLALKLAERPDLIG